jgi:microcystin-dependent protein
MQPGQGPGLTLRDLGETGGSDTVTVLTTEIASHSHMVNVDDDTATATDPSGAKYQKGHFDDGQGNKGGVQVYNNSAPTTPMGQFSVGVAGGSQPHNNLMPYLTLNYCIALQGIYPPRT